MTIYSFSIFNTEWPLLCVSLRRRVGGDSHRRLQEPAVDRGGAAHGVSLSAERLCLSQLINLTGSFVRSSELMNCAPG